MNSDDEKYRFWMINVEFNSGNIEGKWVNLNIQFIFMNMIARIRYKNIT